MKNISSELAAHIAGEVTTLSTCWKVTRRDGTVLGFTDHDNDVEYEGINYYAETGFTPSAVQSSIGFSVDNLDIQGMLDSTAITESDIMAGLYDYAEIQVFMVNYTDLSQGKLILRTGWLGEVSFSKNHFVTEVRGLTQALSQKIGDVFTPVCRAIFGDSKCKLDLIAYTEASIVTSVSNNRVFMASSLSNPTGYFDYGIIKFTSGSNNGFKMEVKNYVLDGSITLVALMPFDISEGDEFEITTGCDKNFQTCINKFNNAVNFRGEPHVPGMDKILETSATRS